MSDNVFSFGAFADFPMSRSLSMGLSLDYWNDEFDSSAQREIEIGDFIIGANSKFNFDTSLQGLRPYVLAGLAAHILQVSSSERYPSDDPSELLSSRDRDLEDAEFEMGVDFGGGVNYRIQQALDLVAELRYRRLFKQTLDLDQLNVSLALAYSM